MKIATLNTWKNEGEYNLRLEAMERLFRESEPDFILLQEVLYVPKLRIHTGKYLADKLGYELIDAPARRKLRKFDEQPFLSYSGLSILSRHPVADFLKVSLPTSAAGGERIALLVRTVFEGHPLVVGNIHLSHRRDEGEIKRRQWATAIESSFQRWGSIPILIGGDMNTNLDQPDKLRLFQYDHCRVVDTVTSVPNPQPESTHPVPANPDQPGRRIDTVFLVQRNSEAHPTITTHSARIGGKSPLPGTAIYPSDHAMVEVTLDFSDV